VILPKDRRFAAYAAGQAAAILALVLDDQRLRNDICWRVFED